MAGRTGDDVQGASDLVNWALLTNVVATGNQFVFRDETPVPPSRRFYRVLQR